MMGGIPPETDWKRLLLLETEVLPRLRPVPKRNAAPWPADGPQPESVAARIATVRRSGRRTATPTSTEEWNCRRQSEV